ncbi:hypothetical protein [Saccharopolyspora sp. 6V]|uniref:hypothetical protein n=1 Tax=Saccharopolyspora sp. 6V TaxID=2877239 RepID=UPI001CD762B4|nr:hypothetical protein [Saccharopolyspora sp. 6V]MCA1194503.1 hypothetical protein [Saccharopolyspora sp. 6V]
MFLLSSATELSTSSSSASDIETVLEQGQQVLQRLHALFVALLGAKATDEDCIRVAASLRRLAKLLDRIAPTCPAPARLDTAPGGRERVFPGQQR